MVPYFKPVGIDLILFSLRIFSIFSGKNLQAKSLKTFSIKHPEIHCYRTSLSNYRQENWITNIPLYGIGIKNIF